MTLFGTPRMKTLNSHFRMDSVKLCQKVRNAVLKSDIERSPSIFEI